MHQSLNKIDMSPSDLEVLIHCHGSCEVHPRGGAPAVNDGIKKLLDHGMIKLIGEKREIYTTSSKGRMWLDYILNVPLPVNSWIIPD